MTFFRQYIAPFIVVLVFLVALLAVTARSFLPNDMAAPAPVEAVSPQPNEVSFTPTSSKTEYFHLGTAALLSGHSTL